MSFLTQLNTIEPKKLFLIDSIGALLSAILLGLILPRFEYFIGISPTVLYGLAVIPCFFAAYSFLCFLIKIENWRLFMKIIAIANTLYCCLTASLMLYFYQKITTLGIIYFTFEIIIILFLANIEWKKASKY